MGVANIEAEEACLLAFLNNDVRVRGVLDPRTRRVRCAFDLMTETGGRLTMSQRVYS